MENTWVYRDRTCAEEYDADRFGGSFGAYLEESETELYASLLADHEGAVLDVGAGTGKLSLSFLKASRQVVTVDSSSEMLSIAVDKSSHLATPVVPAVCDVHEMCFKDDAFECVVCSRVLMHLKDWRKGLSELCRVARDVVVFDFPPMWSYAGANGWLKRVRGLLQKKIRGYNVFSVHQVMRELERNGYEIVSTRRDFFLPVAAHRALNRPELSYKIEKVFAALGLVALFGAPVTVKAVKRRDRAGAAHAGTPEIGDRLQSCVISHAARYDPARRM